MAHSESLCMFCLRDDGGFCGREHTIPEALGNSDTVLERGVVCDKCNNNALAACDGALVTCPPIALMRTAQGVRSKRGRVPVARFRDGSLNFLGEGIKGSHIYLDVSDEALVDGEGSFDLNLSAPWNAKHASRAARSILKIGFEMLAFDNGKAHVMDERFDGVRKAILHGFRGWLAYVTTSGRPSPEVTVRYRSRPIPGTSRLGLYAGIDVWGMRLGTVWPGDYALMRNGLPDTPEIRDLRYLQFDRIPSTARDEVSMSITIEYGDRSEWDETSPFAEKIAEIEGRAVTVVRASPIPPSRP